MPPPGRRVGEFMRACIRTRACRMLASTRATPRMPYARMSMPYARKHARARNTTLALGHCATQTDRVGNGRQSCQKSCSGLQSYHTLPDLPGLVKILSPPKLAPPSARTARQHKTGEIQTITFVRTFAAFPVVVEDGLKHALELSFRHQPVVIFIQPNEVFVNPCCRGGVILVRMGGTVPGQSHRVTQRGNETRKKGKGKDGLGSGGEHCERDR